MLLRLAGHSTGRFDRVSAGMQQSSCHRRSRALPACMRCFSSFSFSSRDYDGVFFYCSSFDGMTVRSACRCSSQTVMAQVAKGMQCTHCMHLSRVARGRVSSHSQPGTHARTETPSSANGASRRQVPKKQLHPSNRRSVVQHRQHQEYSFRSSAVPCRRLASACSDLFPSVGYRTYMLVLGHL